ncbi:MAG TPA: response regulator transcription factor [Halanaerobiales bacterium]|nr:response regulator transcription factor [Halanaerobiales bacterium]
MSNDKIKLLIADDHPFFRQGISLFLDDTAEIIIKAEADNGQLALDKINEDNDFDVILMDLQMPEMDGIEATEKIKNNYPSIKVLILTSFNSWNKVYEALKAGADGYVMKDSKPDELIAAIKAVYTGGVYYGAEVAEQLLKRVNQKSSETEKEELIEPLTDRELEVLALLGRGLSNQEIADELVVSIKTVKTHVSNILAKLEVDSRTQAAVFAIRKGII